MKGAGSLYAAGVFPEGDRGANPIRTRQKNSMHALWNGLLGGRFSEGTVDRRVKQIAATPETVAVGAAALAKPDVLDPLVWLAESRDAAITHAYTHEVLGPIKATMEEGGELPEIYFSEAYLKQAGGVAQLRVAAAGERLAAIWREGIQ